MSFDLTPKFFGKVVNGVLHFYRPELYKKYIEFLEGKEFEMVIEERQKDVSNDQHGYYRATVRWLTKETEMFAGWGEDTLHKFFAEKFLSKIVNEEIHYPNGTIENVTVKVIPSTASLSRKAMSVFMDSVLNWLATEGIYPPEPSQFNFKSYATRKRNAKPESD